MIGPSMSVTDEHCQGRSCGFAKRDYTLRQIPRPAGASAGLRDDAAVGHPPGSYSQLKSSIIDTIRGDSDLPPPCLQHVRFIQGADGEAFHRPLQVFADFK